MIATTRLSVASLSQSISFPSYGSIPSAIFGFFQGSLNSGDCAELVSAEHRNTRTNIDASRFIFAVEIVADGRPILRRRVQVKAPKALGQRPRSHMKEDE